MNTKNKKKTPVSEKIVTLLLYIITAVVIVNLQP